MADSDPLVDVHNLDALLIGTGEFFFAEDALTAAAAGAPGKGYRSFDNLKAFALQPEAEQKEHIGSYRGKRRVDRTFITQTKLGYRLTCDTMGLQKLLFMFFATEATAFTQSALTAANGDALAFSTGSLASQPNLWYDVLYSGVQVRNITALTIATLTENTDFVVDKLLGRVRFLTSQTASRVPVVTAPAITSSSAGYLKALTPQTKNLRKGIGRLVCYDQDPDNIVFDHAGFGCEVYISNQVEVNGEDVASYEVIVKLTSPVGTVFCRED